MVLQKNRQVDQWNLIENSGVNLHIPGHLIFKKEAKIVQGKKNASSRNGADLTKCRHVEECK